MENGFRKLLNSRKFCVAVLDALISLLTYFVGKYFGVAAPDLAVIIGALQPIAILLIAVYAVEDVAKVLSARKTNGKR